ncbi:hypothetical protein [Streptomyces sp. NPDC059063]|uniref:hypothetical protein n=1 Tax=unclassified Streptomyces TaxID=2593676 RepID=UPI0036CE6D5E
MRRHLLVLPALLLAPLVLTGCGSEDAGSGPGSSSGSGSGGGSAPDHAELKARALAAQTRVEHVYLTEADGYEAAKQSAGVLGDDGFQVTYVKRDGGQQFTVYVDRGAVDDKNCRTAPPAAKSCEKDGKGWYRVTAERHEYARSENGLRIQVAADPKAVSRAVLRAAAEKVHRADDRELDAILPERVPGGEPVERGDLPPNGDGAPQDPPGAGG